MRLTRSPLSPGARARRAIVPAQAPPRSPARTHGRRAPRAWQVLTMRRARLIAPCCLMLWLATLAACGDSERPCVEHDECFAREHCASGVCRPYQGRQPTNTR